MRYLFILFFTVFFSFTSAAQEISGLDMDGLMKRVKAHSAKTMVVFWAPWCPHCIRELRIIRDNPQFVADNNLQVIGLTKVCDKRSAEKFVADEKMPFSFFTADSGIYAQLQKIDAVPLTIVFTPDGRQNDLEYGKQDIADLELMLLD